MFVTSALLGRLPEQVQAAEAENMQTLFVH
jgi:hypothetical protein